MLSAKARLASASSCSVDQRTWCSCVVAPQPRRRRRQQRGPHACDPPTVSVAPAPAPPPDPFEEEIQYQDGFLDLALISYLTSKISQEVGIVPTKAGYDGFVEMSEVIMRGRNQAEQKQIVLNVLTSLLPGVIPWTCRTFFRPTELACMTCAVFAKIGFVWLVGEMELQRGDVVTSDGTLRSQLSTAYIKKCRYLEQSGCVGMCVNMCKMPTQEFFAKEFGMPLYMEPNFEDLSCKMVFGQVAPALEDDPVMQQGCFSKCKVVNAALEDTCKKL